MSLEWEQDADDERRQNPDRREHPRREIDYRLENLERSVEANTRELLKINASLGQGFTALVSQLDSRYMPRKEMEAAYVPRAEHERRRRAESALLLQLPLVIFSGASVLVNILLATHHA